MKMFESKKFPVILLMACILLISVSACNDDDEPTPLAVPVLGEATEITDVSFKANWTAVAGADKYLLDVSVENDFSSTVTGYAKKEVTGTSFVVTGLTAETEYFYRLYSKKGATVSNASAVKDATTTD
jgi:hypothetical protein